MMDDVLALSDDDASPGVRKNYKPLTDDEVMGKPFKEK